MDKEMHAVRSFTVNEEQPILFFQRILFEYHGSVL